jgi:tRNA G18 (ribose-2'-O)-methylase SpoU
MPKANSMNSMNSTAWLISLALLVLFGIHHFVHNNVLWSIASCCVTTVVWLGVGRRVEKYINRKTMQVSGLKDVKELFEKRPSLSLFVLDKYKSLLEATGDTSSPDDAIDLKVLSFLRTVPLEQIMFLSTNTMYRISAAKTHQATPDILASTRTIPENTCDLFSSSCRNIVVLDGVNDRRNIGAIFRILEALGVDAVVFTENTKFERRDMCMGSRFTLSRQYGHTSVGTHKLLPTYQDTVEHISSLAKENGRKILAIDNVNDEKALDLRTVRLCSNEKYVFVFGSEGDGISEKMLQCRDALVEIPMPGVFQSFNVQTAVAIAMWHFVNY